MQPKLKYLLERIKDIWFELNQWEEHENTDLIGQVLMLHDYIQFSLQKELQGYIAKLHKALDNIPAGNQREEVVDVLCDLEELVLKEKEEKEEE